MSVKVVVTNSRHYMGVHNDLGYTEGETIGECLEKLVTRVPEINNELFTGEGKLQLNVCILLNKFSTEPDSLKCPVRSGDTIEIIMVGGG